MKAAAMIYFCRKYSLVACLTAATLLFAFF